MYYSALIPGTYALLNFGMFESRKLMFQKVYTMTQTFRNGCFKTTCSLMEIFFSNLIYEH